MQHLPALITDLALILVSAGIITLLFKWLKQPLVLGYIVAGILAGPYITIFPSVGDLESINIWGEIGVIFLLFALGLEFSFKKLMNVGGTALITATTEVVSMLVIGYLLGKSLGWSMMDSIFLGGMLSMSSTTIIIKAFDDLGLRNQKFTGIVFGTLVVEDLVAILMMVLLSTLAASSGFAGEAMFESILKVIFFLVLWFIIGIFLLPVFFKKAKKLMNDETLLIISLGLCLGMVVVATQTGFSAALGAFIMGSILAETVEAEHIEHLIKPVKDLFGAVFFVSVGMMVDPAILVEYAFPVLIITLATLFGKSFFSSFGVLLSGQPLKTSIQAGFSLAQIGEFAFIIASLGFSLGVMSSHIYPIIVAVSVITTFTTPYFIRLANPFADWLYKVLPDSTIEKLERFSSGTKTINRESDWKKLLKKYAGKLFIQSVLLTAVVLFSFRFMYPFIIGHIEGFWGKIISAAVTFVLMAPFIIALISNKSNSSELFMNLWNDNRYNKGRLITLILLRVSVAIFFISIVLIRLFDFKYGTVIFVALAVLTIILIFRRGLNQYGKLENRFMTNLNQREDALNEKYPLKASFDSKLKNQDIHLTTLVVSPDSPYVGKTLQESFIRNDFGINIVKISRGSRSINIPEGTEHLYPLDRIVVVGTDEQIESFMGKIEAVSDLPDDKESEVKLELESLIIEKDSCLDGKTIAESDLGKKFNCVLVGIEREEESIMNPENSEILYAGDLIWVVGERKNINLMCH